MSFAELGGPPVILDGGLASELEARGHDLSDELWSARLLIDAPQEIIAAHTAFFAAGPQSICTGSDPGAGNCGVPVTSAPGADLIGQRHFRASG